SCSHESSALKSCCSATEVLFDKVLLRIWSQWLRRPLSRATKLFALVTLIFRSAMRSERLFHAPISGSMSNLSAANSATAVIAMTVRSCWRLLANMAVGLVPMKVEGELDAGRLPSRHSDVDISNARNSAQLLQRSEQSLVVAGHAGAGDQVQITNLQGF